MSEAQSAVGSGGRWNTVLYDDKHAFVWKLGEGVIDLLNPQPGERILDVGCGTGHLTARMAERGALVVGVDSSPEMIRQARESYPALAFEVADARALRFSEPFDAVFSNAALHWVRPPEAAAAAIFAALKPGGRLVAEFGGQDNIRELVRATEGAMLDAGFTPPAEAYNYYPSIGEYSSLLEAQGFRTTFALHFERPTPLEGGEQGLRNWLAMFGGRFLDAVPEPHRETVIQDIERRLRPCLYHDGGWTADYRRLRIVAIRP